MLDQTRPTGSPFHTALAGAALSDPRLTQMVEKIAEKARLQVERKLLQDWIDSHKQGAGVHTAAMIVWTSDGSGELVQLGEIKQSHGAPRVIIVDGDIADRTPSFRVREDGTLWRAGDQVQVGEVTAPGLGDFFARQIKQLEQTVESLQSAQGRYRR